MSYQNEKIGMMDEGYFVSRGDILKWLNDLLQLNLTKIQQLGSGAVYCQVIDVVHPGKIAINKVNWKAKNDYEFMSNYRILQDAFSKIGIKRYLEVEKLLKAKYQDNLEFAQWLKRYYDLNCGDRGNNYLAEERRGGNNPNFGFADKNVVPKTYNASGVVIPKKEVSPPKKKDPPVQTAPKKTVTTTTTHRPTTSEAGNRTTKRPQKKEQIGSSPKPAKSQENKKHGTSQKPKIQQTDDLSLKEELSRERQELSRYREELERERQDQQIENQQLRKIQQELELEKAEIIRENEESRERQNVLRKELKDMEDKLLMISQILRSDEGADLKIQMISEVVKLPTKTETEDLEAL